MTTSQRITRGSFLGRACSLALALASGGAVSKAFAAETKAPASSAPRASKVPLYSLPFVAFEGKNLDQKIQELMDREEIRELLGRYAQQTAHGINVAYLYTDDGAFVVHTPGRPVLEVRGREALHKLYGQLETGSNPPIPMIHQSLLAISGDNAYGTCSNEVRAVENGKSIVGSGWYEDTFRRVNGRWKFVVRKASFHHWVPIQQGWAQSKSPL